MDANGPILLDRRVTKSATGDRQIVGKPFDHRTVQLKGVEGAAKETIAGSSRQGGRALVQFQDRTADECVDEEAGPVGEERAVGPAKAPFAAAQHDPAAAPGRQAHRR